MLVSSGNNNDFIRKKYKIHRNMWDYSYLHLLVLVSNSLKREKGLVENNCYSNPSSTPVVWRIQEFLGFALGWHIKKQK